MFDQFTFSQLMDTQPRGPRSDIPHNETLSLCLMSLCWVSVFRVKRPQDQQQWRGTKRNINWHRLFPWSGLNATATGDWASAPRPKGRPAALQLFVRKGKALLRGVHASDFTVNAVSLSRKIFKKILNLLFKLFCHII